MFVFAQLSTSVSDDQIRLIIIALLVVAAALAALTVWYFVKTSPSRRVSAAQARRQPAVPNRAVATGVAPEAAAGAARTSADRAPGPTTLRPDDAVVDVDEDDEWDRLTSPEPRRPASN